MDELTQRQVITGYIFITLIILSVVYELFLVILIICNNNLKTLRYYILAAQMSADAIAGISFMFVIAIRITGGKGSTAYRCMITLSRSSHITSLLTMSILSIDRYFAVEKCLQYHTIVTGKRVLFYVTTCTIVPLIISVFLWINVNDFETYRIRIGILNIVVRIIVCIIILAISRYTYVVRQSHIERIMKEKLQFGQSKEKLSLLEQVKASLKDTAKLNIFTSVFLLLQTVFDIYHISITDNLSYVTNILIVISIIVLNTNPILCSITQRELKAAIKRVLKCKKNRVGQIGYNTDFNETLC